MTCSSRLNERENIKVENETSALALPNEQQFRQDIAAINRFQQVVHSNMVAGQDYGVIPGTTKPTLLKPGAEKIAKLLGLSDQYEIMDKAEDWQAAFFRYLIKCRLIHVPTGTVISEGLGECNSMESKYRYRWVGERDLPPGVDKSKLVSQERRSKTGGHWTVYRLDNEDIYSQVNTILKMSKKRALVDAALSAGRLSEVFTQDIEDMNIAEPVIEGEIEEVEAKPKTDLATDAQRKKIFAIMKDYGYTEDNLKAYITMTYKKESSKDLTKKEASELIEAIQSSRIPRVVEVEPEERVADISETQVKSELQPELKPSAEKGQAEDRQITATEIADLKMTLHDRGKDLRWLGDFCNAKHGWNIRDLKDLKRSQLIQIYDELNKPSPAKVR